MLIVNKKVVQSIRSAGRCSWCGEPGNHVHHLRSKGAGQLDVRINLALLCHVCHGDAHAGALRRCDLLAVVAAREKALQSDITRVMDMFRRLIKPSSAQLSRELALLPRSTRELAERELREAGIEIEEAA